MAYPLCTSLSRRVFVIAFLFAGPAMLRGQDPTGEESDWSRITPGDAHFYAEMKDLRGVRSRFQDLGIWDVVRELSEEEPRGATTTQPWHRKAEEFLGMDAEKAIDEIVGRRCALIATEPPEWQNGVLIAELARPEDLKPLLKRWKADAQSDEGPVKKYVLSGGLLLAALDRTIALGPPEDPEGLWGRTVLLMSGRRGPSLSGRSEFASLRSRVGSAHQDLLYVTWPDGSPGSVAGCSRLLAAGNVGTDGIHFEVHGQRIKPQEPDKPCDSSGLTLVPESAVAAIGGTFNFGGLGEQAEEDERNDSMSLVGFLGTFVASSQPSGTLAQNLGPGYTLVWSADRSRKLEYAMPAACLIIPTRATDRQLLMLDTSLGFIAQLIAAFADKNSAEAESNGFQKETVEGVEIRFANVGPALAKRLELPILANAELCWCVMEGKLVLSSSRQQMKDVILARKKPSGGPKLSGGDVAEVFFLRGTPASQMLSSWLNYLQKKRPEMLTRDWWESWASERIEHVTKLGIALAPDKSSPVRAVVQEIEPSSPAHEYLQVGDIITTVDGRVLTTRKPAQEVAQRYRRRGSSRKFRMQVVREGKLTDVEIPVQPANLVDLSGFDPVRAMRQLIVLTQKVQTLTVTRAVSAPDRLEARVEIRWAE